VEKVMQWGIGWLYIGEGQRDGRGPERASIQRLKN
jgi:hypothetical protein